jgi:hypothetical protein
MQSKCPLKKLAGLVKHMHDLNLEAWENELENDFNKTFLLHGIEFGFDIANKENLPVDIWQKIILLPYLVANYLKEAECNFPQPGMLQECSNLHAARVQPWCELNFLHMIKHFYFMALNLALILLIKKICR